MSDTASLLSTYNGHRLLNKHTYIKRYVAPVRCFLTSFMANQELVPASAHGRPRAEQTSPLPGILDIRHHSERRERDQRHK
jgi:hypothetical protein